MAARKRVGKTRPPAAKRGARSGAGPMTQVRVRMYRQGLGDCFLITFGRPGSIRHVLIDCGTLGATTTGVRLKEVVEDIRNETGGKLDVLIATHEHQDHLSGFKSERDLFDKIQPTNVWLAWTEDPRDEIAQRVKKYKNDLGLALCTALKAMPTDPKSVLSQIGLQVQGILATFGEHLGVNDARDGVLGAGKFSPTVDEAMDYVRTRKRATVEFLKPDGKVREEPWLPGFRFYVLGPPRSEAALKDAGMKGSSELYGVMAGLSTAAAFDRAAVKYTEYSLEPRRHETRTRFELQMPFDTRFRREGSKASSGRPLASGYSTKDEEWRRIDGDWLQIAADLALQLDSATNNTSLALAIERVSDGKVLLFPADAQQGNWLSWHDPKLTWTVPGAGGATRQVSATDLLRRTVFYKVGHHGSHNATARGKGLELMESKAELTAFIPVDRAVALERNPKNSWKMPARALYRRLLEQCQGRVVRSDLGWAAESSSAPSRKTESEFDGLGTARDWKTWKTAQVACEKAGMIRIERLYADYVLE